MTNQVQTGKRIGYLAPLSREHVDGLLCVERIRQGLAERVAPERIAAYCNWYWKFHIKPHFRHEEDILLKYLPADNLLGRRMINEHETIRELMISLDRDADRTTLAQFARLIFEHIHFEEEQLFVYMEKELSPEQLEEVHTRLEQKPLQVTEEWKDPFWAKPRETAV